MMKIPAPRNIAQATELLERFASLDGQVAALEGRRQRMLARANAAIDAKALPLIEARDAISARLEPWWAKAGPELAKKRKTIELGGCMIGSRQAAEKLAHDFEDDDKAVEALRATRLANQTTRVKHMLDRAALLTMLQAAKSKGAELLAGLGFRIVPAQETFVLKRVQQGGTVGA